MPLGYPTLGLGEQWVSSVPADMISLASPPGSGAAWPSANRAIYIPVYIDTDGIVTRFWTFNGTTANGNLNVGLFDAAGNLISETGSTAQTGTSVVQSVDVTDFYIPAGWYYLARNHSNTTGTCWRAAPTLAIQRMLGHVQQAVGAIAFPASITPAAIASSYWPFYGLAMRTI